MGKIVTVMNMKGGVGKTTVSMHIAGVLAGHRFIGLEKYKKILLIDYDPQFNLSQAYLPSATYFNLEKARKTTLAILADDDSALNPYHLQVPGNHTPPPVAKLRTVVNQYSDGGHLHIVPATLDLMYVALSNISTQAKPMEERFAKFITECRSEYDLVVVDCHPAGSIFTKTSLQNSDSVLIPVVPQRYAARGIGLMMTFIEARSQSGNTPTPYILFNRTDRVGVSQIENSIRADPKYGKFCLSNTLKNYKAFGDPEEGKGFVWESTKPYSGEALKNLFSVATEFAKKI